MGLSPTGKRRLFTAHAEYGRGGISWTAAKNDTLTGYGEFGQQYMSFNGYTEQSSLSNPFPATVGDGLFRMDVVAHGRFLDACDRWFVRSMGCSAGFGHLGGTSRFVR